MKKNTKLTSIVIMAAFIITTSLACSNGSKQQQSDATENVDSTNNQTAEVKTFGTQDLATFHLYGPVTVVKYDMGEHSTPCIVIFDDNGKLDSLIGYDEYSVQETGQVERDKKTGRITRLWWETEAPWVNDFEYEGDGIVAPSKYTSNNQTGNNKEQTFQWNDDGTLGKATIKEVIHFKEAPQEGSYSVTLSDYDSHGNWTVCTTHDGEYTTVMHRTINYKGEQQTIKEELQKEEKILKDFITDMYNNNRYENADFLKAHCQPILLTKLAEAYEYDGEGLAFWLFRTSSQDGKPGNDKTPSKVLEVKKKGDWYHYTFLDGGWRGENRLKLGLKDGKVYMSDLERVYDESEQDHHSE